MTGVCVCVCAPGWSQSWAGQARLSRPWLTHPWWCPGACRRSGYAIGSRKRCSKGPQWSSTVEDGKEHHDGPRLDSGRIAHSSWSESCGKAYRHTDQPLELQVHTHKHANRQRQKGQIQPLPTLPPGPVGKYTRHFAWTGGWLPYLKLMQDIIIFRVYTHYCHYTY